MTNWKNPEEVKAYNKAYRQRNRDKLRSNDRAYKQADPIRYLLQKARCRAKSLGREFNLTKEDFPNPPTHCPVLGIELVYGGHQGYIPASASLDRIDSSKGYVPGNVAIISLRANVLKCDATLEESRLITKYMELHATQGIRI